MRWTRRQGEERDWYWVCVCCGYDLRGIPGTGACPECASTHPARLSFPDRPAWRAVALVPILVSIALFFWMLSLYGTDMGWLLVLSSAPAAVIGGAGLAFRTTPNLIGWSVGGMVSSLIWVVSLVALANAQTSPGVPIGLFLGLILTWPITVVGAGLGVFIGALIGHRRAPPGRRWVKPAPG